MRVLVYILSSLEGSENANTCDGLCHGSSVTNWHFVLGFSFVSKTGEGSGRAVSVFPPPCMFHILNTMSSRVSAPHRVGVFTNEI